MHCVSELSTHLDSSGEKLFLTPHLRGTFKTQLRVVTIGAVLVVSLHFL